MSDADAFREQFTSRMMSNLDGELDAEVKRLRATVKSQAAEIHRLGKRYDRALADYARHEQTLRDNGIPSHSHAVVMICDLRRALAQISTVCTDNSGDGCDKGMALRFVADIARDFITAQEKEKGK